MLRAIFLNKKARFLFFLFGVFCCSVFAFQDWCKTYLDQIYQGVVGNFIATEDRLLIEKTGGNATYGEITYEAVKALIDEVKFGPNDVFYDLGSGVGKMVVQVYLTSPVKKSVGIELSQTRFNKAQEVYKRLVSDQKIQIGRELNFKQQDILTADLRDATIVFMCATCFSDDFMRRITACFSQCKPGLRVVTLRNLVGGDRFKLVKTLVLPMTWSEKIFVYVYELLDAV